MKACLTIIATVNGNALPMDKFLYYLMQEYITAYISGEDTPSTDEEMQTFYEQVITNYAQLEAFYNYATAQGMEITDDEVNSKLAIVNLYINYFAPTKADKESLLKQNLISYDSWETYSKENAKMLVAKDKVEAALETEISDYTPTDRQIQKYYNENIAIISGKYMYAKHILFSEDNEAMAAECAQRAQAGEDFDALMEEYQDKDGVTEAADLGRFAKSDMVEEFADAAFELSPGEVSGVVQSEYGYHVIYAYEAPTLESQKATITSTLTSDYQTEQLEKKEAKALKTKVKTPKEIKTAYDVYVDTLYDKYGIKIYASIVK
jgi:parvulin-like peptidyl-prolyl isomerase